MDTESGQSGLAASQGPVGMLISSSGFLRHSGSLVTLRHSKPVLSFSKGVRVLSVLSVFIRVPFFLAFLASLP